VPELKSALRFTATGSTALIDRSPQTPKANRIATEIAIENELQNPVVQPVKILNFREVGDFSRQNYLSKLLF
jgi:hypothetical protein